MNTKTKSIIGLGYTPIDNSYQANLSNSYKDKAYLAGTSSSEPKMCTILSEPFKVPIKSIHGDKETRLHDMVIVEFEGESHITLFDESGVFKMPEENLISVDTRAVLRPNEAEGEFKHNTLYKFYYDKQREFFVVINGRAIEETSTAFNFLTVQP